jgi:hypothetical protein
MATSLNGDSGIGLSGYTDTLAQSFFVDRNLLLTKVDLYFSDKDSQLPVELSIRKVENDRPSANVITNSVVVVDASSIVTSANANIATSFTFPVPVRLDSGQYCFALSSDTKKHRVYVGQIGGEDTATGSTISKNPYSGVMFMSTNGVNWSIDQTRDIKFKLYRANVITSTATVDFVMAKNTLSTPFITVLENDPFQSFNRVSTVRVNHKKHGFPSGAYVKFNGLTGEFNYTTNATSNVVTFNSIPVTLLANTYLQVSNITLDSYTVDVNANAMVLANISGGRFGRSGITTTTLLPFAAVYPSVGTETPPRTNIGYKLKTTDSSFTVSNFEDISTDTKEFSDTRILVDSKNRTTSMSGAESFTYRVTLASSDPYVSPMIDTSFASAVFVTPDINSPSSADNLNVDLVTIASANAKISFSATGNVSIGGSLEQANVKTMAPGAFVTITNAGDPTNNGTFRLTAVSNDGTFFNIPSANVEPQGNAITIVYRPRYISDEAASGSSTHANYVTRKIELATPATGLLIRFAVSKPAGSDIEVYYKLQSGNEAAGFDSKEYTQVSLGTITNTVDGQFVDIEKFVDSLSSFNAFVLKFVLKSTSIAAYPKIKDLRIIALE